MKKGIVLLWVLLAVLTAALIVSIVFIVQGAKKNAVQDTNNTSYSIEYLQDEYDVGDDIVYHFTVYSDVKLTAVTYKLGTTAGEQTIDNIKTGKSAELKQAPKNAGNYYADTKVQIIQTSELSDGYYTLVFFGYDKDNNRYELTLKPYSFKLVAVEAETPEAA